MIDDYMKDYSLALDARSEKQRQDAKEIQGRVKRSLEQKVRMDKLQKRYSNKFSSN